MHDTPLAENIVQDVFLKIWENRTQLDPSGNIKSYLYTLVKNHALKQLRHDEVVTRASGELVELAESPPSPDAVLGERDLRVAVRNAIDELPERCREIFSMSRFDNLRYSEIAEILDISPKTVETQMSRALKQLREHLSDFLSDLS